MAWSGTTNRTSVTAQAGRLGVAERFVLPLKPGNAGGGKGPQFKTNAASSEGPGDWATYQLRRVFRNCRWRCTRKRRLKPVIASTRCTTRSPPTERGGHSDARPTVTAPHLDSTENGPPVLRSHCPKPVIDVEADSDVRATLSSPAGRSTRSARASRRGTPCSRRRRRGSRDWLTIDSSLVGSRNVKPLREPKPRRVLSGRIAGAYGRGRLAKMLVTARVQPRGRGRHGEPGVPASGCRKSRSARRRCCRPSGAHRRSRIRAGAGRLRPSPLPIAPR